MPSEHIMNSLRLAAAEAAQMAATMRGLPNEIDRQEGFADGLQAALDIIAAATPQEDDRG